MHRAPSPLRLLALLALLLLVASPGPLLARSAAPLLEASTAGRRPAGLEATPRFSAPPPPELSAQAAYVFDATTGTELFALQADERRAPASLTKVATALVVLDRGDLDELVTIEPSDLVDDTQSQVGLVAGDRLSGRDLLKGLLIPSGNDAARALARTVGQRLQREGGPTTDKPIEAFVAEMNRLPASLDLAGTHFTNPTGLDEADHVSTARDLGRLAARAMEDPVFAEIVASPSATLPSERRAEGYFVQTTNDLLREGLVSGIKTGTTGEAGGCLISAVDVGENRVIAVILGSPVDADNESPARYADTRLVLDALSREYRWFDPAEPGAVDGLAEELSAWQTELPTGPAIVVPAGRADELRYRLLLGPPGRPDEEVGKVLFFVGPDLLSERPVLQAADPALALDPKRVISLAA